MPPIIRKLVSLSKICLKIKRQILYYYIMILPIFFPADQIYWCFIGSSSMSFSDRHKCVCIFLLIGYVIFLLSRGMVAGKGCPTRRIIPQLSALCSLSLVHSLFEHLWIWIPDYFKYRSRGGFVGFACRLWPFLKQPRTYRMAPCCR